MTDYCDSPEFYKHSIFSANTASIQITLYYDDVEICNPLGSKRCKHKLGTNNGILLVQINVDHIILVNAGAFYVSINNLPPEQRSLLKSIHLATLVKVRYIKEYGMNAVLAPIVNDFNGGSRLIARGGGFRA